MSRSWGHLLLSDGRRATRALAHAFRSNPLVTVAVLATVLTVAILTAQAGAVVTALSLGRPYGLTALTLVTLIAGLSLGSAIASSSPRLRSFDGQFRSAPVPPVVFTLALVAVPTALLLAATAGLLAVAFADAYSALQLDGNVGWAWLFAAWFVAAGMCGGALSTLLTGDAAARLACIPFCASICLLGLGGSAWAGMPAWTWLASFLPAAPMGDAIESRAFGVQVSGASAIALASLSIAVLAWAGGRDARPPSAPLSRFSVTFGGPAWLAIGLWLALSLARSARARWLVFALLLGTAAGLAIRASDDRSGLLGAMVAMALLLATGEVALSLSREFRLGRWLLNSTTVPAWSRALGWIIGAGSTAALLGAVAVAPLVALNGAASGELAWIPAASFGVVFAGRLVPWSDHSAGHQALSSITAGVCVIAAIAVDVWLVGKLGFFLGHAAAILGTGTAAAAGVLAIEAGEDG